MSDHFDISGFFETTEFEIAQVACNFENECLQFKKIKRLLGDKIV